LEGVEVLTINEEKGTVTFTVNKQPLVLTVAESGAPDGMAGRTFNLKSADSGQLLVIYQELADRTVIRSPSLPHVTIDLRSDGPLSSEAALLELAQAFAGKSVEIIPHGTKFAFAVPASQLAKFRIIPPPEETDPNCPEEKLPAGMIRFGEADSDQVLEIYQELTGRTVISAANWPQSKITIRSQTALTRREAAYALETAMRMGNISISAHQDEFVVVQSSLSAEPPRKFPSNQSAAPAPTAVKVPDQQLKLLGADQEKLLKLYASLLGRDALPLESTLPPQKLTIRSQTPLTTPKAVYALDALAAVNGFQFVLVGDKQVKLVRAPTGPPVAP
jgi:hypothetical protein